MNVVHQIKHFAYLINFNPLISHLKDRCSYHHILDKKLRFSKVRQPWLRENHTHKFIIQFSTVEGVCTGEYQNTQ